jgi:dTMP kinase
MLGFGKAVKKDDAKRGRLIVIDGIDGSGKSTQLELLNNELKLAGYKTEVIHFPQHGQPSASMADEYLSGKYGQLSPEAASIFYAVDRFSAKDKIENWLSEGKVVLTDRYVTANAGHQGGKIDGDFKRLKFFKWLNNLEYVIFSLPRPDLNVILSIPYMTAYKLLKERKNAGGVVNDIHEKNLTHLRLAEESYRQIAKLFPNTKLIDCVSGEGKQQKLLSQQEIHNKVWEMVRRIGLKDFKI